MTHRYDAYGLTDADVPFARAWEAYGRKIGLTPARVEEGFRWYGQAFKPGMTAPQAAASFRDFAGRTWTDGEVELAATFHNAVVTHGPQHLMPQDSERRSRLQELVAMTRDPGHDYYTGHNSKELQAEHLELLEHEPVAAAHQLDVKRLAELDAMVGSPTSDYYVGNNAKALQHEHLQMLEAQEAGRAAPDAAADSTIQQRTTVATAEVAASA